MPPSHRSGSCQGTLIAYSSHRVFIATSKRDHIYLLTVYAKGVKDDLTASERDAWRKAVEAINND